MPWDKPLSGMIKEIRREVEEDSQRLALYALGRFQQDTPVGNPDLWKVPYAPRGYVGGTLKGSFTADKVQNGWLIGSNQDYAEAIWEDGHSARLAEGAVDVLVADMVKL